MESYGRRVAVNLPFERAITATIRALAQEGLHVISQVDAQEFLKRTIQREVGRYSFLQAVVPQVAFEALREDLSIGALVPTSIAIFELADGETAIVMADPFGDVSSNLAWRRSSPQLAALHDRTCDMLARAAGRLEKMTPRSVESVADATAA